MKDWHLKMRLAFWNEFNSGALGILLIALLCLVPTGSPIAKDSNASALTLREALVLSVKSHPLIAARKQEYQAAIGDLAAARWSAFPEASFNFRGFREEEGREPQDQETLTVSQPIWTGGRLSGNIDVAKANKAAAKFAVAEAEQSLLLDTVQAFFDLHRAEMKLQISSDNVDEHLRLYNIMERRVSASTSPEVDLRLANARLAFSRSQLLQNTNVLEVSRAKLEQFIGKPVYRVSVAQSDNIKKYPLFEAEKLAVSFSPKIRKMRAEIESLEASERVTKSALFPQLSLGYEKKFGEVSSNQDSEQVFLGLDFQPGAGLSSRSSSAASRSRRRALQDSLIALEREIRREVQITWREYSGAEMQLSPTSLLVESTSEVVGSYLRQYTVGRKSWLDVLNAQRELVQAKLALVDHQAKASSTAFKMQILVGDLNTDTVVIQSD